MKRDLEVARNQVDILRSNNATASGEDVHPPPPPQPLSAPPSPQSRQLERGAVAIQERRLHELEASERRCDVHAKGKQHKHLYFIHRILKFNSRSYFYFTFSSTTERKAIETIMEQKIKRLVDTIATSVKGGSTSAGSARQQQQQTLRDVAALQRLVNASIAALHQSP